MWPVYSLLLLIAQTLACGDYVVKRGRAIEVGRWTDEQIAAERRRDSAAKAWHFRTVASSGASTGPVRQPVSC
jgi:hypothetical protein